MSVFVCVSVSVCMFGVHVGSCSPFCLLVSVWTDGPARTQSRLYSPCEKSCECTYVCVGVCPAASLLCIYGTRCLICTQRHTYTDTFAPTWTVPVSGILLVPGLQSVPLIIKNLNPALNPAVELLELVTDVSPCDPASRCGLVLIQLTCEVYKPWL